MAPTASASPAGLSSLNQALNDRLDADIIRVRAEIQALTKRKNVLKSSLLSSTKVQSYLNAYENNVPIDLTPLRNQAQHNETNFHRLAYGVTSFPFTDPNPDTSDRPLLGVRFDIPSQTGRFEKAPYYIFFKRTQEDNTISPATASESITENPNNNLKIHHHTIPALVPLHEYEAKYLPDPAPSTQHDRQGRDEGYFSPSPTNERAFGHTSSNNDNTNTSTSTSPSQDLHALVASVRRDLTSWHLRTDAITLLSEQLGLSDPTSSSSIASPSDENEAVPSYSLQSLASTALDARFSRLVWQNGTVGRIRITDDGYVDKAVVIGGTGVEGQMDRMKDVERMLCTGKDGGRLKVMDLLARLQEVEMKVNRGGENGIDGDNGDDNMQVDS